MDKLFPKDLVKVGDLIYTTSSDTGIVLKVCPCTLKVCWIIVTNYTTHKAPVSAFKRYKASDIHYIDRSCNYWIVNK